jgi:hypothetical protein
MNYSIKIDWKSKLVSNNKLPIYDAKVNDPAKSLSNIPVSSTKTLAYFQDIRQLKEVLTSTIDLEKVKNNLSNLNNALKEAFKPEDFKKQFENDIDNVSELEAYQNLAAFIYRVKRAIMIAHMIIVLKESTAPEESNEVANLKAKEERLRKFLNDSVRLVLNTNELMDIV